jgi:CHAD domain-containing protein
MSSWRLRIIGATGRPLGWWRKPEILNLLLSEKKSLNQVRAELEARISTSQVFRLRMQAKRAYEIRNGELIEIAQNPGD